MNENQKIVYGWLVSTCRIESVGVAYAFQKLTEPDVEALHNFYKLTPLEKDEVLYKAIIEVDGEKAF